jgi:magnesium-transporting ATPase (P-type)
MAASASTSERPSVEQRPYKHSVEEVCAYFDVDLDRGLTEEQVEAQRGLYGSNEFQAKERMFWFLSCFVDVCVCVCMYVCMCISPAVVMLSHNTMCPT